MFNLINQLSENNHEIIPFSIYYSQNKKTEYSKYFVSPLGSQDEVYFDDQKMTPKTLLKTLSRLFYSKEVERSVSKLVDETQPQIAYVLHYLRKLSPSLLVGLQKKKIPIIVRLSDYAMICPQSHCLRENQPCTLCVAASLKNSIKHRCIKNSKPASILNAMATWFHNSKDYFSLIDQFVTTNSFMYQKMLESGWPEDKLTCIPTFTDIKKLSHSENFLKNNYICYIGRIENLKGIHILIDAFIKMKKRTKNDVVLKIAGTGSGAYLSELKNKIRNYDMESCIQFVGQLDILAISKFLGKALFSVVPSLCFENLPNSILESYSCGTPVFASDIGSLSGCVKEGVTGVLFKCGDVNDLADKLEFYLNNQSLLPEMAVNSRREALDKYAPEVHIASLEKLFHKFV